MKSIKLHTKRMFWKINNADNKYMRKKNEALILLSIIFLLTILAGLKEPEIMGFRICGWSWVLSFIVSCLFIFIIRGNRIIFPFVWWVPFFLYLLLVSDLSQKEDIYRFLIFLCPVLVGVAASRFYLYNYNKLRTYYFRAVLGLWFIYILAVILSENMRVPIDIYAIAGPPMTAVLLMIIALEDPFLRRMKLYVFSAACILFCIILEARMPIIIILSLFLFRIKNISFIIRMIMFVTVCLIFIILFQYSIIQSYFFRYGHGDFIDLLSLDPNIIKTSGRLYAWPIYWDAIMKQPWFGHGSTFSVDFGAYAFGGWAHPHNEYIRILFDYGFVGAVLFLIPILNLVYQCINGTRHALTEETKWLCSVGLWGIFSMFLLGLTGNVLMYVAWYGNLLFALIGFGLARFKFEQSTYISKN